MNGAFVELEHQLEVGPVIVSVQYTFDPANPIPHLVVINGVKDGLVYYSDPADGTAQSLSKHSRVRERKIHCCPTTLK